MSKIHDSEKGITRIILDCIGGACARVEIQHQLEKIVISDDHGGIVTLTVREWQQMLDEVKVKA